LASGFLGCDIGGDLSPPGEDGDLAVQAATIDGEGCVVGRRGGDEAALELLERHVDDLVRHAVRIPLIVNPTQRCRLLAGPSG